MDAARYRRIVALRLSLALSLALSWTTGATAEKLYKWTDENGVTHFSSQPPLTEQHRARQETLRVTTNITLSDVQQQFVALAELSAPTLCQQRRGDNRSRCIQAQLAAARDIGQLAYENSSPRQRFTIQTCQTRYMLDKSRPVDFVAMRQCIDSAALY